MTKWLSTEEMDYRRDLAGGGAPVSGMVDAAVEGRPQFVQQRDGRQVLVVSGKYFEQTKPNLKSVLLLVQVRRAADASRKMQALDQEIIRHVGIEPADCPILALKSSVHFRADFAPIAERVIVAIALGPVVADQATLNFQHVRAEVRRQPRRL